MIRVLCCFIFLSACSVYQSDARKVLESRGLSVATVATMSAKVEEGCVEAPADQKLKVEANGFIPRVIRHQSSGLYYICP